MSERERAGAEDVVLDELWLREMEEKAQQFSKPTDGDVTIFRVPENILATKPEAYLPKIISLGPYHHKRMQKWNDRIKWPYLNRFLTRNPDLRMQDYARVIKLSERETRRAYPPNLPDMKSDEFMTMMLLDCCFLLEFLLALYKKHEQQLNSEKKDGADQEEDLLASKARWALPLILHDILLLENQVPLFLLQRLFQKAAANSSTRSDIKFVDLMQDFFHQFSILDSFITENQSKSHDLLHRFLTYMKLKSKPTMKKRITQENLTKSYHLLHLFHTYIEPAESTKPRAVFHSFRRPICARELREAKVKLVKKKRNFLDIKFQQPQFYDVHKLWSGLLEIPQILIDDGTDTLFRNLIAFEQCFPLVSDHVTSYACFMDSIVDNNADVALLRRREIIVNGLGSDEEVAQLFNHLCREVLFNPTSSYLGKVVEELDKHCTNPLNKCWASFKHTYFSNPWAIITVLAAIILFVLTFLQTLYTMLPK